MNVILYCSIIAVILVLYGSRIYRLRSLRNDAMKQRNVSWPMVGAIGARGADV